MHELLLQYWVTGGALMPILAAVSYAIWFMFLRLRRQLIAASLAPAMLAAECDDDLDWIDRDILLLTALTASAPLLGLLGTVAGMVTTFEAVSSGDGYSPSAVSSGISQALITTQFGLIIAIPGLFGRARLCRLADRTRVSLRVWRRKQTEENGVPA